MWDNDGSPAGALLELRRRLVEGLAFARLSRTLLATKAEVSRTTVYEALRDGGAVPSVETVTALASVLSLPVEELLELRGRAAPSAEQGHGEVLRPGRLVSQWDPHDLEVHPAGEATAYGGARVLSGYVPREHDRVLADAVKDASGGRSRMVVLVGSSSTGKTRACWEAVQRLAQADPEWRLWHPFDPTRAEAALDDLHRVGPRTVVWLNEAHHYLGDPVHGERIAAAVHRLLTDTVRAPVLVMGTLWQGYADQFGVIPPAGGPDPHSRVRELLTGRRVTVPDSFDASALTAARSLAAAGDALLAGALSRAGGHGRIAQDLAGAPELLRRYEEGTPAARAILEVAMDARRLGVGLHLPQVFLTDAAEDYLTDSDFQHLTRDWAGAAYAELARPVHGKQTPLARVRHRSSRTPPGGSSAPAEGVPAPAGPVFRLADYLEQHGRTIRRPLCPPVSFWHAAHAHLTSSDDLHRLSEAATDRHRLQWADHLRHRAAAAGNTASMRRLADRLEKAGDQAGAAALLRRAADANSGDALVTLSAFRKRAGDWDGARALLRRAADVSSDPDLWILAATLLDQLGNSGDADPLVQRAGEAGKTEGWRVMVLNREIRQDWEGAERLAQAAADAGHPEFLCVLAQERHSRDPDGAKALVQRAADAGDTVSLGWLARWQGEAGNWDQAEALTQRAADAGQRHAWRWLAEQQAGGDRAAAEAYAQRAADGGDQGVWVCLAERRRRAGDWEEAERLARKSADADDVGAFNWLAVHLKEAGRWAEADAFAQRAGDKGYPRALGYLAEQWDGDREWAAVRAQRAAQIGYFRSLSLLACRWEDAGDPDWAEALAQRSADAGSHGAWAELADQRLSAGDRKGAEASARRAADAGDTHGSDLSLPGQWVFKRLWPHGLDPDGRATPPWS